MSLIETIHERQVAGRRVQVLASHLADLVPHGGTVLDVGCGDGQIAWELEQLRPDLTLKGVDVLVRDGTAVPVDHFDGLHLPFDDNSFDTVMFVDVLHHADELESLMREAARVACKAVVIKDHSLQGFAAGMTLRFMDWVGNHRYGVALPYNYQRPDQWHAMWKRCGLRVEQCESQLGLYPWPASMVFERKLHFAVRLSVTSEATGARG